MCQTTNKLEEFNKLKRSVLLPMFLLIDYRHLTIAEAEVDVFLADAEVGVARAQIDTVFKVEELLGGRPELSVDAFKVFQVALKQVVHVNGPEPFVTELLPWLNLEVGQNAIGYQFLGRLGVSLQNLWLKVLTVRETGKNFEELKPLQAIRGSCGRTLELQVCGDESPVDTRNVDDTVHDSAFTGEVAEVKRSDVGPR